MNREVKKFLSRAAIFFGPVVLAFILMEIYVWGMPNSYNLKKNYLQKQSQEIDVLALGSSHSLFGINPDYFSLKGFNLANVSQTFFYDKELVLGNLSATPNLRCVLIESSYFSLGYELKDSADNCRDYYYYYFWGIKYPGLKLDARALSCAALATPSKVVDLLFKGQPIIDIQENGWEPFNDSQPLSKESAEKRVIDHETMIKEENYPKNIAYLKELLAELKKRGIGAAIVDLPVHENYYHFLKPEIEATNKEIFGKLCQDYGCGVFDFSRDGRFGDGDFSDSDHLAPAGAEKFSKILDKEVLPAVCGR